ncbi:MAG: hypothetical protein JXB30_16625 [Anaerolineae bacterium]|nr:hypothetical protein [Anaerolineae bacterium]
MPPTIDSTRQAIELAKAGKTQEARGMLVDLLKVDQNNVDIWATLARLSETPKDAAYCLKQVLRIQPDNEWARSSLQHLSQRKATPDGEPQPQDVPFQAHQPSGKQSKPVLSKSGAIALIGLMTGLLVVSIAAAVQFPAGLFSPATGEPDLQSATPLPSVSTLSPNAVSPAIIDQKTLLPTVNVWNITSTIFPLTTTGGNTTATQTIQTLTATLAPTPTLSQTPIVTPTDYPTPTDPPEPDDVPTDEPVPALGPCDCYGASLTCRDFDTQAEAQACYDYCLEETGIDIFFLDTNNNNIACEDLPS